MSLQNTTSALPITTITTTSTTTSTTAEWVTRWAFPQVTITCSLPDPARASYPYAWMTATGDALSADLSSYRATAQPASGTVIFTGCHDINVADAASTSSSSSIPGNEHSGSLQQSPTCTTTIAIATDSRSSETDTIPTAVTITSIPITTTMTTTDTNTDTNTIDSIYITVTESIYVFASEDGSLLSSSTSIIGEEEAATMISAAAPASSAVSNMTTLPLPLSSPTRTASVNLSARTGLSHAASPTWTTRYRPLPHASGRKLQPQPTHDIRVDQGELESRSKRSVKSDLTLSFSVIVVASVAVMVVSMLS